MVAVVWVHFNELLLLGISTGQTLQFKFSATLPNSFCWVSAEAIMHRGCNPNHVPNFYRDTLSPLLVPTATKQLVEWCMNERLLAATMSCTLCNRSMHLTNRAAKLDAKVW